MDSLSLLALLKPTVRFVADAGRMKRLLLYPFAAVLALFGLSGPVRRRNSRFQMAAEFRDAGGVRPDAGASGGGAGV